MLDEEDEDLIGVTSAAERLDRLVQSRRAGRRDVHVEDMHHGVTVSWLAQVFSMDPKTVKVKLADCPPLHRRQNGYVYSLPIACQYLVKPAMSPEQMLKNMKPADLPAQFQQSFWAAALARQKWELAAGDLWRTEAVREVLSSTLKTIKHTIQLWSDTVEQQVGLTEPQRNLILKMADELQSEVHKSLVMQAQNGQTGPQLSELPQMLGEEDDGSDLI